MSVQLINPPLILEARHLKKYFNLGSSLLPAHRRAVRAVDDVSLSVGRGETLGLVGESGSGKSTLGRCLVRLYDITAGEIWFDGSNITHIGRSALRALQPRMQMVFQDPYASLNPRRRIGNSIAEPLRVHRNLSRSGIENRTAELLHLVGLRPEHRQRFPHELSGGQRQRVGIARALALEPALIVADEPVSALDVSIQAQIVNLFLDLQERLSLTYVFVAHDLSVVRQIATRIAVMYLGVIVEIGLAEAVLNHPAHPYTEALISAVPLASLHGKARVVLGEERLNPVDPPLGCRFHARCPISRDRCKQERPALRAVDELHQVACHYPLLHGTASSVGAT